MRKRWNMNIFAANTKTKKEEKSNTKNKIDKRPEKIKNKKSYARIFPRYLKMHIRKKKKRKEV